MKFDTDIQRPCISCGQNEARRDGVCTTCAAALVDLDLTSVRALWVGPCAHCGFRGRSIVTRSCPRCGEKAVAA